MTANVVACSVCRTKNRVPLAAAGTPRCAKCHVDLPWLVEADDGEFTAAARTRLAVLVDLWAPWCGPCKMVAPEFEKFAKSAVGEIVLAKVNTEEQSSIAHRYGIRSIPTLIIFQGGNEAARTSGARPAAGIQEFVNQSLGQAKA